MTVQFLQGHLETIREATAQTLVELIKLYKAVQLHASDEMQWDLEALEWYAEARLESMQRRASW